METYASIKMFLYGFGCFAAAIVAIAIAFLIAFYVFMKWCIWSDRRDEFKRGQEVIRRRGLVQNASLLLLLVLVLGCRTAPTQSGVVNFGVAPGYVFHGGQPTQPGWIFLHDVLHVTNVVKLNLATEGSDWDAHMLGMTVHYFPITTAQQITGQGVETAIRNAVAAITPGTYVHCAHGMNRTMSAMGLYLVQHGYTKAQAEKEMNRFGWESSFPGLVSFWRFKVIDTPSTRATTQP